MKCFYFGCESKESIGHYLFTNDQDHYRSIQFLEGGFRVNCLDGMIKDRGQSQATLYRLCGWTFVSMEDCSADGRPNSHSTFMAQGNFTFRQLMLLAEKHWPKQYARIESAAPIVLVMDADGMNVS